MCDVLAIARGGSTMGRKVETVQMTQPRKLMTNKAKCQILAAALRYLNSQHIFANRTPETRIQFLLARVSRER